jgi:hypothetical protein
MSVFFNTVSAANRVVPSTIQLVKTTLMQDHSYSWWINRRNVYHNGVNYFTTIGADKHAYVNKYDGNTLESIQVKTFTIRDEHNAPALLMRDNDILVVSHPRSNTDFRVRTLSYDFQTLGSEILINSDAGFSAANYAQVFQNSAGRIFIFCREDANYWAVTYSDDGGLSWSAHQLFTYRLGEKLYMNGVQDGDSIIFGGYSHPNIGATNFLWSLKFDTITGDVSESGTNIGNLYSGWSYKNTNAFTKIFEPTLGKMRFLDIAFSADKSKIYALCLDIEDDNSNGKYYLVKWDYNTNANITKTYIVDSGIDTYTTYFGGAYFVTSYDEEWNNQIYLCRENNGYWYTEKWSYNGTSLTKTQDIDSLEATAAGLSLTRPEPPIGSTAGGLKVIYQKGDYNESYTEWDNELIGVK